MIGRHAGLALGLALLAAGCVDGRTTRGDGGRLPMDGSVPGGDSGSTGGDAGTVARDARVVDRDAGTGDRDSGRDAGATPLRVCQLGCTVTSDCTTASPAFDADNYRCESGVCRYTGCVSDAECRSTFSSDRYVCRDPGTGVRSCLIGCATPADCTTGSPAFDADNYRCASGVCLYEGCNDDAECTASFGAGYGCRALEPPATPLPIPTATDNCVRLCSVVADCSTGSPAFDADNYACTSGACVYAGCRDDAECRSSLSSDSYVCR